MDVENLKKILPLDKLYEDVAHPAMKEVGGMLHNTVKVARFLFAPIDYLAKQQDRFQNYLNRISKKVRDENMIETSPRIVGEVFESLKYSEQESILTELFINLLANSIDRTKQNKCHPAFPNIIKQLSSDEAVILFYLNKRIFEMKSHSVFDSENMLFKSNDVIHNEFPLDNLNLPSKFFIYMDHLNSLNIAGIWQKGNQVPTYDEKGVQNGVDIYSEIRLTKFGEMFVNSVVPENIENFSDVKSDYLDTVNNI